MKPFLFASSLLLLLAALPVQSYYLKGHHNNGTATITPPPSSASASASALTSEKPLICRIVELEVEFDTTVISPDYDSQSPSSSFDPQQHDEQHGGDEHNKNNNNNNNNNKEEQRTFMCETTSNQEHDGQSGMMYLLPPNFNDPYIQASVDGPKTVVIPHGKAIRESMDNPTAHVTYPSNVKMTIMNDHDVDMDAPLDNSHDDAENETSTKSINNSSSSSSSIQSFGHRSLSSSSRVKCQGTISILVVRVVALDGAPNPTKEQLAGHVFGIGSQRQAVSLKSQFEACSIGKYNIVPVVTSSPSSSSSSGSSDIDANNDANNDEDDMIVDGVTDIYLNRNVTGVNTNEFENTLVSLTLDRLGNNGNNVGTNFPDHVMYCLPEGTLLRNRQFVAYGYLAHWRTVFSNNWCINFSALTHELGHNLNLMHSGEGNRAYGDLTGIMGYATGGKPRTCFNANKHYFLGWYNERVKEIDVSSSPWGGILVPFINYIDTSPSESVILKIGKTIYLQYNLAQGFNAGTRERPNEIVIVENRGISSPSNLLGGFRPNPNPNPNPNPTPTMMEEESFFVIENFDGMGIPLKIEACSISESSFASSSLSSSTTESSMFMRIRLNVQLLDGQQESTCERELTSFPSLTPSEIPSFIPSQIPSIDPTMLPSFVPSTSSFPSSSWLDVPSFVPTFDYCEDKPGFVSLDGMNKISCNFLSRNRNLMDMYCHPEHEAYYHCEDTCGYCDDGCKDSRNKKFRINNRLGSKGCIWLSVRPLWQKILCRPGWEAYEVCGETCNNPTCERSTGIREELSESPSSSPSIPSSSGSDSSSFGVCQDSTGNDVFVVNRRLGRRGCDWLSRSRSWQRVLCVVRHDAYRMCPELCGACRRSDNNNNNKDNNQNNSDGDGDEECSDDVNALIFVNKLFGSKSCEWLSLRRVASNRLCGVVGSEARRYCRKTCGSC